MHLPASVFLLRMIDIVMHIALQGPIAARRVGEGPTACLHRQVGRFLHRLHREIFGRLDDHSPLPTDPRDDRGPIFVVVPPPRLTFLAAPTRGGPTPSSRPGALGPSVQPCDTGHPPPQCPPPADQSRRRQPHCAATSTSDSSCGYGPPALGQYAGTNMRGTTGRWRESSGRGSAYCRPRG